MLSLAFILLLLASVGGEARSLKNIIHGEQVAHDHTAQAYRLQALALLASSPSATTNGTLLATAATRTSGSLLTTTASGTANTDATVAGFSIYSASNLPTGVLEPPSSCADALMATIECNSTILLMGTNPSFDAASLEPMCTASCTSSLESYRATVVAACVGYSMPTSNNKTYPPTTAIDSISGPFNAGCLKDPTTGEYCNTIFQTYGTVPPQGILGYPQSELCTPCMLGTLNASLSNPTTFSSVGYASLQAALNECGSSYDSYNVTNPPGSRTTIFTPGPATTPVGTNATVSSSCNITGRNVTITGNSTCTSIANQYSVTWYDVVSNNPSFNFANCTISSGTKLCLPQACTTYIPTPNQTCLDVVTAANSGPLASLNQSISEMQLTNFNPVLGKGCTQIANQYGQSICISPHGGFPNVGGGHVAAPTPTAIVPPPGPTVSGTTSNCGAWYLISPGATCSQVTMNNSITLSEFQILNPEVNSDCTNLWANYNYCVAPYPPLSATPTLPPLANGTAVYMSMSVPPIITPTPYAYPTGWSTAPTAVAPGTVVNGCYYYYQVHTGDNCTSVTQTFGLSYQDFVTWNNNPSSPCPSLTPGSYVCVIVLNITDTAPPKPTNAAPGSGPSGCYEWYTIVDGDGCGSVETKFNLAEAQFFALNPELYSNCTNLILGEAYCVESVPTTPTTTTSATPTSMTPTPTATSTVTANLEPGSWTNCTTYYDVQSGDNCNTIETRYNIAFSDLLLWNPGINTACTNLALMSYCVGVPGGCADVYTTVSGDNCFGIETKFGITAAQLQSLNPWLDANCDIQVGQNLCV